MNEFYLSLVMLDWAKDSIKKGTLLARRNC